MWPGADDGRQWHQVFFQNPCGTRVALAPWHKMRHAQGCQLHDLLKTFVVRHVDDNMCACRRQMPGLHGVRDRSSSPSHLKERGEGFNSCYVFNVQAQSRLGVD